MGTVISGVFDLTLFEHRKKGFKEQVDVRFGRAGGGQLLNIGSSVLISSQEARTTGSKGKVHVGWRRRRATKERLGRTRRRKERRNEGIE